MSKQRIIITIAIVFIFAISALSFSAVPYPGGGELTSGVVYENVNGAIRYPQGQHIITNWDIDGSVDDYNWTIQQTSPYQYVDPDGMDIDEAIKYPGVTITTSSPYNLQRIGDTYVALGDDSDPVIARTYEKSFLVNGETVVYQYNLMYFGLDITYKTNADAYYKPSGPYLSNYFLFSDWGYYFEASQVDIVARQSFTFSPWVPNGVYNSTTDENNVTTTYTITKGWLGILDAKLFYRDIGLVDEAIEGTSLPDKQHENYGHEVEDVIEVGSSLNKYYPDTGVGAVTIDFEDDRAIASIPSSIDIESSCSLKAGAQYHVDIGGHWDAIAVRNVKVQYKIVVPVVATIEMTKLVVTGSQQQETDEDNTFYKPLIPVWSDVDESIAESAEWWSNLFSSPNMALLLIAGILILILIIYAVLRFRRV